MINIVRYRKVYSVGRAVICYSIQAIMFARWKLFYLFRSAGYYKTYICEGESANKHSLQVACWSITDHYLCSFKTEQLSDEARTSQRGLDCPPPYLTGATNVQHHLVSHHGNSLVHPEWKILVCRSFSGPKKR